MFLLVEWVLEGLFSVIGITSVTSPRKDFEGYEEGETVEAKFRGKKYPAKIVMKSDSKKYLETKLTAIPSKGMTSSKKADSHMFEDEAPPCKKQKQTDNEGTNCNVNNKKSDKSEISTGFSSKEMAEMLLRKKTNDQQQDHKNCVSKKEFEELKDDLRKLKRRVRDLEKHSNALSLPTPSPSTLSIPTPSTPTLSTPTPSTPTLSTPTPSTPTLSTPTPTLSIPMSPSPLPCPPSPPLPYSPTLSPTSSQLTSLNTNNTTTYNGHTLDNLKDTISHTDSLYPAVRILLLQLFPEEYIVTHSVSGKAANSKTDKKPPFDFRLYTAMVNILKTKFNCTNKDITEKVHSVQKSIKKQFQKK